MLSLSSKLSAILFKSKLLPFAICDSALKIGVVGVLGITGINIPVQAASTEPVGMSMNTDNPTADLQLISLNVDESTVDGKAVGVNDLDIEENTVDQTDDDIDALGDAAAVETVEADLTNIPDEVAQVSLNAISPETLKTFVAVVDLVRRQYIDPVNDEALFDNAMSGMLTKLDSHAEFLNAEAYENLRAFTEGDVGDVGLKAVYKPDEGYWVVTDIVDESPADKKGITIGDYIHQIGEFKIDGDRQSDDVEQLLNGIAGTQVDVTVSKAGRRKRVITLQRNNTHRQNIETRLVDGIAVIKLPAFQNNTREKILQSLTSLDAPVTGVLLDLRDNPGGVLTSAVKVASLFMSDTDVVQVKSRQSKLRTLSTQDTALLKPLPVVVLQNRYSASAAEVLASSLQTQQRATIVGEVSYGKGSVQSVIPLNDEQAVKLTVAHYLTAAGKKIDKIGVQPDIALSGNERTWEQQAIDILRPQVHSSGLHFVKKDNNYSMTDTAKDGL
ncbi:S41 family peptidase [Psychrobacter sp. ENNN9_III]|uniref:S41 family peptidase n=1 Tax=Psychrobacter sp. ENNN9_III TaxID=1254334 RepID=UPI000B22792F|nr:S41 family peptidase [Psychrobacter sp. ENNN9_III]